MENRGLIQLDTCREFDSFGNSTRIKNNPGTITLHTSNRFFDYPDFASPNLVGRLNDDEFCDLEIFIDETLISSNENAPKNIDISLKQYIMTKECVIDQIVDLEKSTVSNKTKKEIFDIKHAIKQLRKELRKQNRLYDYLKNQYSF